MVDSRSKREQLKFMDYENLISSPSIQPRQRPRSGDASQPESRSSFPAHGTNGRRRPLGLRNKRCLRDGRFTPQHSTRGRPLLSPTINCFVILSLFIAGLSLGTSLEDVLGLPDWIPLMPEGRAGANDVAEFFGGGEVLQMFHLQATAQLYEKGGLNHDLSFILTAVAFFSLDRPDFKVSMTYHPTNMTISLLPTISEDGRELHWEHQAASVSYTLDIDQAYWSGTAYMGETTGAFFSNAVESSLKYLRDNPRYQPFSVYQEYPGVEYLAASSCDEYVWTLLVKAQELGVHLIPNLLPKKHKIIIYTQTRPEMIQLDGGGDNDGNPGDGGGDSSRVGGENPDSASSSSPSSWRSSSSSASNAEEVDQGEGGGEGRRIMIEKEEGEEAEAEAEAAGSAGGDNDRRLRVRSRSGQGLGERRRQRLNPKVERATVTAGVVSTGSRLLLEGEEGGDGHAGPSTPAPFATASSSGSGHDRGDDDEQDLGGLSRGGSDDGNDASYGTVASGENAEQATTEPEMEYVEDTPYAVGEGEGEGASEVATAAAGDSTKTLEPTASPIEAEDDREGQEPLDEWQEVVAYYQSLQMCLQERKLSFATSLEDFVESFDCLDDVAFISLGPYEYYKVNLTSTRLDHVSLPEDLPAVEVAENDVKLSDLFLMLWILLIILCGVHGMLWQGGVMQHWMKASGYGQVVEDNNADGDPEDGSRPDRQAWLTRQIMTEYVRLGQRFLSKHEEEVPLPSVADGSGDGIASSVSSAGASVAGNEGTGKGSRSGDFSPASAAEAGTGAGAGNVADGGANKRGAARAAKGRRSLESGGGYDWVEEPDHDFVGFAEGGDDEHDNMNDDFFDSRLEDAGWSRGGGVREKRSRRGPQGRLLGGGAPPAAQSAVVGGEQEGLEMGSAAAWRQRSRTVEERPVGMGAMGEMLGATGAEVDKGYGGRAVAGAREGSALRGLRGKRRRSSHFPPGWSDAAVAWGTNYNDGGRDRWIRFPDSPPLQQQQSKPGGGVHLPRDADDDGGGGDYREDGLRVNGSQMELYSENADGVPSSSEGSKPRGGGDGGEEKLDSIRPVPEGRTAESTLDPNR